MNFKILLKSVSTVLLLIGLPLALNKSTQLIIKKDLVTRLNNAAGITNSPNKTAATTHQNGFLYMCYAALLLSLATFISLPFVARFGILLEAVTYFFMSSKLSSFSSMNMLQWVILTWIVITMLYAFYRARTCTMLQKNGPLAPSATPIVKKDTGIITILFSILLLISTPLGLQLFGDTVRATLIGLKIVDQQTYKVGRQSNAYQTNPKENMKWRIINKKMSFFVFMAWIIFMLSIVTFISVPPFLQIGIWVESLYLLGFAILFSGHTSGLTFYLPLAILLFFLSATLYKIEAKSLL